MFKGLMKKIFGNIGMNTVSGGMPANTDRMAGRPNPDEYKTREAGTVINDMDAQSRDTDHQCHAKGAGPSTWVKEIHYDNRDGDDTLKVMFRDGFTALYDDISPEEAKQFEASPSKGRWVWQNLVGLPYKKG